MKLSFTSIFFASTIPALVAGDVISLTPDNYHSLTAGKAVFIKFFAPWCGHCKAMASDYEKLAEAHASSTDKVIAEVDCTDDNAKALCQEHGVQGFPTLKYGDPAALTDYNGGRDFDSLNDFVSQELKLSCSPFNLDLCNDDEKKLIEDIMKMDDDKLNDEIDKVEQIMEEADKVLQEGIEGLQERFESMMSAHEENLDKMKAESNYDLKKTILSMKKKETGEGNGEL